MWGYGAGRHRGYGRMRGGGFGRYSSLYNPHQVRTITGRVDRIDNVYPGGEAMGPGVAIRVQLSGMEPDMVPSWQLPPGDLQPTYVWVHLGPSWYVQQQFPDLHTGEIVTVTGSPALWRGEYVLLANSVQLGSQVVVFRNPAGLPLWAGGWQNWGGSPVIGALPAYPGYAVVPVYPGYAAAPTSALMTINGTIQNVQNVPAMGGFGAGTVLNILTPQNNVISVAVFPSSFASQMGVQFLPGQPVTIYGTMAMVNGQQMLVANQIDYNGERFALSNVNGVYTWGTVPMTAALPSGGPLSPPAAPMGSGY